MLDLKMPANSWVVPNTKQFNTPVLIEQSRTFLQHADNAITQICENYKPTIECEAELIHAARDYCKHLAFHHHLVSRLGRLD